MFASFCYIQHMLIFNTKYNDFIATWMVQHKWQTVNTLFWICTEKYGKTKHEWQFVSIVYDSVQALLLFTMLNICLTIHGWNNYSIYLNVNTRAVFTGAKLPIVALRKAASWQPIVSVAYRSSCKIVSAFMHSLAK